MTAWYLHASHRPACVLWSGPVPVHLVISASGRMAANVPKPHMHAGRHEQEAPGLGQRKRHV
eukprot:359303-Chlamydomonas_euryale.AAC.6